MTGTADGGGTAMAGMAGSARCFGRSPTTIFLTTAMWGYGYDPSFWGYGYGDIYAGMFAPYGYDDLTGYLPQGGALFRRRGSARLAGGKFSAGRAVANVRRGQP